VNIDRGPVAVVLVGGSVVLAVLIGRTEWWVSYLVALALLATVTVRIRGRTAYRWLSAVVRYRTGHAARARGRGRLPAVVDVDVASGVCGVGRDGSVLTAMIQLAPNLDLPTVIAKNTTYTEDTLSIDTLSAMLDQYGIAVEIDIVSTGRRVRSLGNYGLLYDQLTAGHPVVGERFTWLVIRLDVERNLAVLACRGPLAREAPKAIATAAIRIAARLRERGVAAQVLPAARHREAAQLLHGGVELTELTEKWRRLVSPAPGVAVTSYWIDLNDLGGGSLDGCWTQHPGRTTVTVSLWSTGVGAEKTWAVRAFVRFVGPTVKSPAVSWLRSLGGQQSEALMASLPGGAGGRALGARTEVAGASLSGLRIPIGPSGQIVGAIAGQAQHALAVQLFDPVRYWRRRRRIKAAITLRVAQQLVLRAAVVGADVAVHTRRPQRWQRLVAEIGDTRAVYLVSPDEAPSRGTVDDTRVTVAVFDRIAPYPTAAYTTISVGDPGMPQRLPAEVTIDQVGEAVVDIGLPMGVVRVNLIEPMGEARYLDTEEQLPLVPALNGGRRADTTTSAG
jgi:type VII secretion protein EccE